MRAAAVRFRRASASPHFVKSPSLHFVERESRYGCLRSADRAAQRKTRPAHSSGSWRNFRRSISRIRLISRFSHAELLAQPPCNSPRLLRGGAVSRPSLPLSLSNSRSTFKGPGACREPAMKPTASLADRAPHFGRSLRRSGPPLPSSISASRDKPTRSCISGRCRSCHGEGRRKIHIHAMRATRRK